MLQLPLIARCALSVILAAFSLSYGFAPSFAANQDPIIENGKPMARPQKDDDSIGTATMSGDGTIVLDLRAEHGDGTVGDARLIYPRDHKDYAKILEHLGAMTPGVPKPVPPWRDK
jgi:hypothetical protein